MQLCSNAAIQRKQVDYLFRFGFGGKETKKQVAKIRILFGLRNILIRPNKPNPEINELNNGIVDIVSLI